MQPNYITRRRSQKPADNNSAFINLEDDDESDENKVHTSSTWNSFLPSANFVNNISSQINSVDLLNKPLSYVKSWSNFASVEATNTQPQLQQEDSTTHLDFSIPVAMPCRDRTNEFTATVKSMQMRVQGNGHVNQKGVRHTLQDTQNFNRMAKKVGVDITNTCAKLEKLTILAKKRSIFDDNSKEIDHLTEVVKQDIGGLNHQIKTLQEFLNGHNGGSSSSAKNHSKTVVFSLQSRLATISNEFKSVLDVRTENLKQQQARRSHFSQSQGVPSSLPASASTGNMGSILLADEQAAQNGDVAISMDALEQSRFQQQMNLIDEQDQYIQSRADTMQNIESTIVELGSIFQQLAHMVQEQGEMVERIDSHVEHTSMNIEAAHTELLKYFRSISQNRWLFLKVFGVLIVFFIFFVVFLA